MLHKIAADTGNSHFFRDTVVLVSYIAGQTQNDEVNSILSSHFSMPLQHHCQLHIIPMRFSDTNYDNRHRLGMDVPGLSTDLESCRTRTTPDSGPCLQLQRSTGPGRGARNPFRRSREDAAATKSTLQTSAGRCGRPTHYLRTSILLRSSDVSYTIFLDSSPRLLLPHPL